MNKRWSRCIVPVVATLLAASASTLPAAPGATGTPHWSAKGLFLVGCTCGVPCSCGITGKLAGGCEEVEVYRFQSGRFDGTDLAGGRAAAAGKPGEWVILYLDPTTPAPQRAALQKIAEKRVTELMGVKPEAVRLAPITITGADGAYQATVGDFIHLRGEPLLGLDKKHPIELRNILDPWLKDSFQGQTLSSSVKDGSHQFDLNGTNFQWAQAQVGE